MPSLESAVRASTLHTKDVYVSIEGGLISEIFSISKKCALSTIHLFKENMGRVLYFTRNICLFHYQILTTLTINQKSMEDGGVDSNVIESWQHKMGQMADFPPLLASSVFDS